MKFTQWCSGCNRRIEVETDKVAVVDCPVCGRPLMPCPICHGTMDTRDLGCRRGCSLTIDFIKKSDKFDN